MTKLEYVLNAIRKECPELEPQVLEWLWGQGTEIGNPEIRLEHLLRAINPKCCFCRLDSEGAITINIKDNHIECDYDLTKSVTENLKTNSDLTDFLYSLFNQEDL